MMARKFPYGLTDLYRKILGDVFEGDATDDQLSKAADLIFDIADDEFQTHCRRIDEGTAIEWVARAVALSKIEGSNH